MRLCTRYLSNSNTRAYPKEQPAMYSDPADYWIPRWDGIILRLYEGAAVVGALSVATVLVASRSGYHHSHLCTAISRNPIARIPYFIYSP